MKVYKNILTGELYTAENKVRAWLYFYEKGKEQHRKEYAHDG